MTVRTPTKKVQNNIHDIDIAHSEEALDPFSVPGVVVRIIPTRAPLVPVVPFIAPSYIPSQWLTPVFFDALNRFSEFIKMKALLQWSVGTILELATWIHGLVRVGSICV